MILSVTFCCVWKENNSNVLWKYSTFPMFPSLLPPIPMHSLQWMGIMFPLDTFHSLPLPSHSFAPLPPSSSSPFPSSSLYLLLLGHLRIFSLPSSFLPFFIFSTTFFPLIFSSSPCLPYPFPLPSVSLLLPFRSATLSLFSLSRSLFSLVAFGFDTYTYFGTYFRLKKVDTTVSLV